jgi:hypothetical protein
MTARCMKCGEDREMKNTEETKTSNGRRMMKGICSVCGTKMSKFLPNQA